MWIVLGTGAIFIYMCIQADRRESAIVQAVPSAFVSALVTSALLVVAFLDHPISRYSLSKDARGHRPVREPGAARPGSANRELRELRGRVGARHGVVDL